MAPQSRQSRQPQPPRQPQQARQTLRVNPIRCEGHGMCAELLPEIITLDEWGYPVFDTHAVSHDLELHARRAVAACPALALVLTKERPR